MNNEGVKLELSRDEALVLYDFLSRFNRDKSPRIEDQAEEEVLNNILCDLESALAEPFRKDYDTLLEEARGRVRYTES